MLINRESLLKKFESGALLFQPDVRKVIESEPEAIIRCKDCNYKVLTTDGEYNPDDIVCSLWESDGFCADDYCSRAEGMTDCRPNSAVDIVRCGNCKYYKDHHCTYIYQISIPHSPGFYCAWGERKSWEDPSHPCADSVMMGD